MWCACIPPSICLPCWNLWWNYCAAKEVPPLRKNMHVAHLLGKLVGHVSIFLNSHEFPWTNSTLSWFKRLKFALPTSFSIPELSLEPTLLASRWWCLPSPTSHSLIVPSKPFDRRCCSSSDNSLGNYKHNYKYNHRGTVMQNTILTLRNSYTKLL